MVGKVGHSFLCPSFEKDVKNKFLEQVYYRLNTNLSERREEVETSVERVEEEAIAYV